MNADLLRQLYGIEGQTAVVTDSGGNTSVDIAPVLAAAGARVVIADAGTALTDPIAERISAAGGQALGLTCDVEREADVIALFERVQATWGAPHIVVNCAAVTHNGPLTDFTEAQWDAVMSVDLKSVFFCMREAIRHMRPTGRGGRIVNITTVGALHPVLEGNGAYGAARAGVAGLVRAAALDHARDGILINCVLPGAVPGKVRFHPDTQRRLERGDLRGPGVDFERRWPLGLCPPRDLAAAVLYLAGPSGGYITGQALPLDGGFLIS